MLNLNSKCYQFVLKTSKMVTFYHLSEFYHHMVKTNKMVTFDTLKSFLPTHGKNGKKGNFSFKLKMVTFYLQ